MAKRRRLLKLIVLLVAIAGAFSLALVVAAIGLRVWNEREYDERAFARIADVPTAQSPRIAIVFGAGLWNDASTPSPVLYDRIATAAELYRAGRVRKLLLTGDNRFKDYNEPEVMRRVAREMGVPDEDLISDFAGRSTYNSCYRAREIFAVRDAVLVTQEFHLNRALYLCNSLDVGSIGVEADRRSYGRRSRAWWQVRETLATVRAWVDLNLLHPTPILGERLPIVISDESEVR